MKYALGFFILVLALSGTIHSSAQCSALSGPSYSNTCSTDFFTAVSASGTGVTSTITFTGASCVGTYFSYFATQGITAPTGNTVSIPVNRCISTYVGYVSVYIDWNNDNIYQSTELAAGPYTYVAGVTTHTFSFAVPTTGLVTGTHLHMRIMLTEAATGAPCTGTYGETLDFYFQANCSTLPSIVVSPSSSAICSGGSGVSLAASGAGTGGVYSWSPATGLSASTGSPVTATPASTTTYTVTGRTSIGCINTTTAVVSVNPTPAAISGSSAVCQGASVLLTDGTSGGTWSSSSSNASVGSSSGVVTGMSAGTATISYTVGGCSATKVITVNPLPASITGTLNVCVGLSNTLGNSTLGGSWSSSNTNATIGSSSGVVTGNTIGTSIITYTLPTGCFSTATVTVNAVPLPIAGTLTVCPGSTTTLTDPSGGGTWSSSNANVTVGSLSGVVTGVTSGTSIITYTNSSGCFAVATVTVNSLPSSILGVLNVCLGSSATLFDITSGGTWSASNTNVSIGSSSGVVSGLAVGTSVISYTLPTGCYVTAVVTVNALPSAIVGSGNVCEGASVSLSDPTSGGTWSSSSTNVTVGSGSGIVGGVSSGTAVITYTAGSGCYVTKTITINPAPAAILGVSGICVGSSALMFDASGSGTWSVSNANAVIGSSSGLVTGVTAGTVTITYTVAANGCFATFPFTVNALPATITGTPAVCIGLATALGDITTGGIWSSSNSNASVGSASGIVTGVAAGTSVITYTLPTGCFNTINVTINPLPASIGGSDNVCIGFTTLFSDVTTGGLWSASNANAAVGSSSGIVTGVAAGVSVISYTLGTGCYATKPITVDVLPAVIAGPAHVCAGAAISLTDVTAGGTWSASNANVTIGSSTGFVTGVTAGTSVISYTVGTGCYTTTIITVDPLPVAISGASHVCVGSFVSLSDLTIGGSWSSSNSNATVGSSSGIVTGIIAGSVTITYTLSTGCFVTRSITVDPLPAPIGGSLNVCVGSVVTLSDASTGGTWSAGNSNAIIGSASGMVTGVFSGTTPVMYTLSTGCIATAVLTVNPLPLPISGALAVCIGQADLVTDPSAGGTWSSSNGNVTIGSASGIVTGVLAGTSVLSYTLPTGCYTIAVETVNPLPLPVTGPANVCVGSFTLLNDLTPSGTWTSSNSHCAIGTVSGIVSGISAGVSTITYTLPTGCYTTYGITVDPLPAAISGTLSACPGSTSALSCATVGGVWSSSNTNVIIGSSTGLVTGVAAGTSVITYLLPSGCFVTAMFTVNPLPSAILGATVVCMGSNSLFSDASLGGSWSASNTNASIGATSGIVTGISSGTTVISYTLVTGCFATTVITINALPAPIGGSTAVCIGASITCSDPGGGVWSSGSANAVVGSSSGIVTGVNAGTADITYTLGTGCTVSQTITINPLPAAISGPAQVCEGATIALSDVSVGGSWSASGGSILVGSLSGLVTGVAAGVASVTYTLPTGCFTASFISVNPLPATISGPSGVCIGSTAALMGAPLGGSWSSSNANIAIGPLSGIAGGISLGTSLITYTIPTGCFITRSMTVNPLPGPIAGTAAVCVGQTTTLTDPGGGSWSSSDAGIAMVGSSSGVVSGVSSGICTITYTLATGCYRLQNVTVNPLPAAITGATSICLGTSSLLAGVGGGSWSSSNPAIASVGATSGLVSGNAIGSAIITYTISTGCFVTATVSVIALPSPISGPSSVCEGATITLFGAGGGLWTSSNTNVTVGSMSGVVTGITSGTALISYTLGTGCMVTKAITVNVAPAPIAGPYAICLGNTVTMTNTVSGGSWTSSAPAIASVGITSGIVTGVAIGTATISYTLPGGCFSTIAVSVNSVPAPIAGSSSVCQGQTTVLSDPGGGTWSSSNPALASIGSSSGLVTGVSSGNVMITYTIGSGCFITKLFTVNPLPAPIVGSANICLGSTASLSDASPGGHWSSSSPAIATIGSLSGIVTGAALGSSVITYTIGSGCYITAGVTVNPLPAAITGVLTLCPGTSSPLTDPTAGGSWSSGNLSVASIGSVSGVVSGTAAGLAPITYTSALGCRISAIVTVNPLPANILGTLSICTGSSATLTSASPGGLWSSSNALIASVGSGSGVVLGVSSGTSSISYTLPTGCFISRVVTINPLPSPVIGPSTVCVGTTAVFSNPVVGGMWVSGSPSVATAGSLSGLITGISAGLAVITYTLPSGCMVTRSVNVAPTPLPIVGVSQVCAGSSITMSDPSSGGYWSSGSTAIAAIGSLSGIVSGFSSGTAIISYTDVLTGCAAIKPINVNPVSAILGASSVCVGGTSAYTDSVLGGTWSSSAPAIGSISSAGVVTGLSAGAIVVSYTTPVGCISTFNVSVNAVPPPVMGPDHVCEGAFVSLSNTLSGGSWSACNPAIGTVDATSGVVAGIAAGALVISYSVAGCTAVHPLTVHSLPAPFVGALQVCLGSSEVLSDAVAGGVWTSASPSIAAVGSSSGIVSGLATGIAAITYTLATGCYVTAAETVNPLPAGIAGPSVVCQGASVVLTNATSGGLWSSSLPSVASIGSLSGLVDAIAAGISVITYTAGSGCFVTKSITVNPLPAPIAGPDQICAGSVAAMSDSVSGGLWSIPLSGVASVGSSSGVVTAITAGIFNVYYTLTSTGCTVTKSLTVNPLPVPITGVSNLCVGQTTPFASAGIGGFWSSSNTAIAAVGSSTGIISGVAAGNVVITFTLATGCFATKLLTVIPVPAPIAGPSSVCLNSSITLFDSIPGGRWYSANPSIVAIDSLSGVATGNVVGSTAITYTLGFGCTVAKFITVKPLPAVYAVTGGGSYCAGTSGVPVGLSGSANGVIYFLYNGATPTGSFTGTGSAINMGLQTVAGTYTVTATTVATGCSNAMSGAAVIHILPSVLPAVTITSLPSGPVCEGTAVTYSQATVNGGSAPTYQWSINGVSVATSASYSFIPANGDVISVRLNSNANCAVPAVASASVSQVVNPYLHPSVSIAATPADHICRGDLITISAIPVAGGPSPAYTWMKNGVNSGGGSAFTYGAANNDRVYCIMHSNYLCQLAAVDTSADIVVSVDSPLTPVVSISADPGTLVHKGQTVTLTAHVDNGGTAPAYQWLINGIPVAGATNATYSSSNFGYPQEDSVTCMVTSSGTCTATSFNWVFIKVVPVGVATIGSPDKIVLFPNPSAGSFLISANTIVDDEFTLTVVNMLGQEVHRSFIRSSNGMLQHQVDLGNDVPDGNYMVTLRSLNQVIHLPVAVER